MMTEYPEVEDDDASDRELLAIWMGVLPPLRRLKTLEEVADYMGRDLAELRAWSERADVRESAMRHRRAELLENANDFVDAITADALTGRAESIKALHDLTGDFDLTAELLRKALQEAAGRALASGIDPTLDALFSSLTQVMKG